MSLSATSPVDSPSSRPRAFQAIVDRIEQAVRSGELKPGDRLPSERDLVAEYGVSRSSVREALRVLESRHLISRNLGERRGAEVVAYSPEPARRTLSLMTQSVRLGDLVQFRMVADGAATLMAARRRTPQQLVLLERNMARMRESLHVDPAAFSAADLEFHQMIAEMAGNEVLQVCGDTVRESCLDLIQQTILVSQSRTALMLQSVAHHREVFHAISDGDGLLASRLTRESLYSYYAEHLDDEDRAIIADLVLEVGGTLRA
jgi:DNA-binding FadR family transcriptional regulator